jgi:hypothetical protein
MFSTAEDLSRFAQMMLNSGELNGARIASPLTIAKFTEPQSPPDQSILRGLGWDIDSQYSSTRGELFPIGSYGHTGFTGTSMWIDPVSKTYVILLANSVHPDLRPSLVPLRAKVATITAASFGITTQKSRSPVTTRLSPDRARGAKSRAMAPPSAASTCLWRTNSSPCRQAHRPDHQSHQRGPRRPAQHRPHPSRGRSDCDPLLAEHGFLGVEDREGIKTRKTRPPAYRSSASTARLAAPRDAARVDARSSTSRMSARASTLTRPPWRTRWKKRAKAKIPYYVLDRPIPSPASAWRAR